MRLPSSRRTASTASRRLGDRIRALRKSAGLSQEALAERATIHSTYLSSLERGHRNPTLNVLVAISAALRVPITTLFDSLDR